MVFLDSIEVTGNSKFLDMTLVRLAHRIFLTIRQDAGNFGGDTCKAKRFEKVV